MEEACEHMAKIIRDLSTFTRRSTWEFTDINITEIIESTLSFSGRQLERQGIKIEKSYDNNLPLIKEDESQLRQVVLNIVTNARDAISGDGFEIAIIDLILPDIDGVEVCKEIKRRSPYIKPFLMSGHMNELVERRKDFISSGGCKDVIIKPFNEGELVRLARHVFKKGEC